MNTTKVGKRYAQSLLQLAVETGALEAVKSDVENVKFYLCSI